MKKGFTIIELLVASLLLGMLVTILTMIFNQSSIAWRTGMASTSDMDDARQGIAEIRDESDNAFIWDSKTHVLLSPWKEDGSLRTRACDVDDPSLEPQKIKTTFAEDAKETDIAMLSVGGDDADHQMKNYVVNVMCAGPDREFETEDDIWSWPDDFE